MSALTLSLTCFSLNFLSIQPLISLQRSSDQDLQTTHLLCGLHDRHLGHAGCKSQEVNGLNCLHAEHVNLVAIMNSILVQWVQWLHRSQTSPRLGAQSTQFTTR